MFTRIRRILNRLRSRALIPVVKMIAPTHSEMGLIAFVSRDDLSPIALFRLDGWNEVLFSDLNLRAQDTVCVFGAYLGDSVQEYRDRFDSQVIGLEPIANFCRSLWSRFGTDPKVEILEVGASDRSVSIQITLFNDSTSLYKDGGVLETIRCVDIVELFDSFESLPHLLEINIEGAEFRVLNRLLNSKYSKSVNTLLIQFHDFVEDSELMKAEIRKRLSEEYVEVFSYPYVWERWDLKQK